MAEDTDATDPVTVEIVRGALSGTAEEMKSVVMRGSFSPLLSLSGDLSCAVADADGNVVAQGEDIPVHLGAMPFTIQGLLSHARMYPLEPGDVLITNDPYIGGNHLPDVTVVSPVFADDQVAAFCASRVHWPDVGGTHPGSSASVTDIVQEGVRIPPLKLVRAGHLDEDVVALMLANMRLPSDRRGDLEAQLAGNRRGCLRITELIERYGARTLADVFAQAQAHSETLVRHGLAALPDGEFDYAEQLDRGGLDIEDADVTIRIRVIIAGDEIHCDFTGSSACIRGSVNAPFAVTASSTYYAVLALLGGRIPPNSGAYRPIRITAPEASVVNAQYPWPVVAANTETSSRIVDVIFGALAQVLPGNVAAGSYGSAGVYTLSGTDPRRGRPFVHYETIGGGMGAARDHHGVGGLRVHMGNTMNLPVETIESRIPVIVRRYELIQDSGGAGDAHGGAGVRKVIEADADRIAFAVLGERAETPAAGVAGGGSGRSAHFAVHTTDGYQHPLPPKTSSPPLLARGDQLWLETAGGGGHGKEVDHVN